MKYRALVFTNSLLLLAYLLLMNFTDMTGAFALLLFGAFWGGVGVAFITYLILRIGKGKSGAKLNLIFLITRAIFFLAVPLQAGLEINLEYFPHSPEELVFTPHFLTIPLFIAFVVIALSLDTWQYVKWPSDISELNKTHQFTPDQERRINQIALWFTAIILPITSFSDFYITSVIFLAAVSAFTISKFENKTLRIYCGAGLVVAMLISISTNFIEYPGFLLRILNFAYIGYAFLQWRMFLSKNKFFDKKER